MTIDELNDLCKASVFDMAGAIGLSKEDLAGAAFLLTEGRITPDEAARLVRLGAIIGYQYAKKEPPKKQTQETSTDGNNREGPESSTSQAE